MRIVLLGPPGSGKGTQASALQQRRAIPHIASGDLLRAHIADNTDLGRRARPFMDRGDLVPDDLILDMMAARLVEPDAQNGYTLDGFPRTVAQARDLDQRLQALGHRLDAVIYLRVPEDELLRRLSGRRICPNCNAIYHVDTMPPNQKDICDHCGSALIQRQDERPEVVRNRLQVYAEQTEPLLEYYQSRRLLHEIDGTIGVDRVLAEVAEAVGRASQQVAGEHRT
ncbi:MAG: adenylate kinase [Armatimonadota bacterium]|nr:MAG: adenylate kinase [Armatimonadota bacterium]